MIASESEITLTKVAGNHVEFKSQHAVMVQVLGQGNPDSYPSATWNFLNYLRSIPISQMDFMWGQKEAVGDPNILRWSPRRKGGEKMK